MYLFIKYTGKRYHNLWLPEVMYVKANGDYCLLVTKGKTYIYHSTMKNMEKVLSFSPKFQRVSRKYIANTDFIDQIAEHKIHVNNIVMLISETRTDSNRRKNIYKEMGLKIRNPSYFKTSLNYGT